MKKHLVAAFLGTVLAITASVFVPTDAPRAQITATAPLAGSSISVPTTAGGTLLVNANPTRRALTICNVGATNPVWVAPVPPPGQTGVTVASQGAGSYLLSQIAAAGNGVVPSCLQFTMAVSASGTPNTLVTAGFNAIAVGGATNVTVGEY